MSKKSIDKRLHFIAQALNKGITNNATLANEWYISNKAAKLETAEALRRFAAWIR